MSESGGRGESRASNVPPSFEWKYPSKQQYFHDSFHVGSGTYDVRNYKQAIEASRKVFNEAQEFGYQFSILDIGGGFHGELNPDVPFKRFATAIKDSLTKHFPPELGVKIISEPGQYVVRSAFTLVADVIGKCAPRWEGKAAESFNWFYIFDPFIWVTPKLILTRGFFF